MKKIFIAGGILAVLLIGVVVMLVLSINPIIEKAVNTYGPRLTKSTVHLNEAEVSFLSGEGALRGLTIGNPEGFKSPEAMRVDTIRVRVDTDTLTSDTIVIELVEVVSPTLTYEKDGGTDNFKALARNIKQSTISKGGSGEGDAAGGDSGPGKKVIIKDFIITNATMNLALTALEGKGVTVPVGDVHLKNLGEDKGGATPSEVFGQVFGTLSGKATSAAGDAIGKMGDQIKKGGETLGGAVKSLFE